MASCFTFLLFGDIGLGVGFVALVKLDLLTIR